MDPELDVFCVFEGGGAKGVAHVGFLTALDTHHAYRVRGFAGTSAGAIVAALAAAGWKGEELFREVNGRRESAAVEFLNEKLKEDITVLSDFIEPAEWRKIKFIKWIADFANRSDDIASVIDVGEVIRFSLVALAWSILALLLAAAMASIFSEHRLWIVASILLSIAAAPILVMLAYFSGRYAGFASMDRPRRLLEELLRAKIPSHSDRGVTFLDVKRETGHSLKIVAADLENGCLKLFGDKSTPDDLVSDAVAASAAIPLLFKPVKIGKRQYCDGGIVSNLPAWAFDSERMDNLDCLTVTCEIAPPLKHIISRPNLRGLRLIARVAITATFGSAGLNTRGLLRHIPLSAWASFNMLDFDKVQHQADLILVSAKQAGIKMDLERNHRTNIDGLFAMLKDECETRGLNAEKVRVSYVRHVTLLEEPPSAYHLWNCRGFDGYADAGIVLPVADSFIGQALKEGRAKFFNLYDAQTAARYKSVGNGRLADRLPSDRGWVAVVPVPEQRRHSLVSVAVCVDGADTVPNDIQDSLLGKINDLVRSFV